MSSNSTVSSLATPFAEAPVTPAQHLRLALFGVIAQVIETCQDGDVGAALETHPFLADYQLEIQGRTEVAQPVAVQWWQAVCDWERAVVQRGLHLPLVALRDAGLQSLDLELLLAVGLVEEDPRFGAVFEHAQINERRPTFGLLIAWWRGAGDEDRADEVRAGLQRLIDHGLIRVANPDAPRASWALAPVLPVWDALRGDPPALTWLRLTPFASLPALDDYVSSGEVRQACATLPDLLTGAPAPLLLLRGPAHNGRKTLAGALARGLGRSILTVREPVFDDEVRWRLLGALATMSGAVPVVELELTPGESRALPPLPLNSGPLVVVTGRHGAWSAPDGRPVLVIDLPLPGPAERRRHWDVCWPREANDAVRQCAAEMRLSSGNIRAVASAAGGFAKLAGRDAIERDDLRRASRTLQKARLETMATRLESRGALNDVIVDDSTRDELQALVARCRWREQLADSQAIGGGSVGVRALFGGPSGTGKTLAARMLAAELDKDVYRLDLAATVNKFLGETEKNLNRALNAAEELDVVLLLDEGDALMANRTDVGSSNDRYANLETNFLLQRIESFEGILFVTTNQMDRIDRAFARRMDVVVNFRSPDAWRRLEILKVHLASEDLDHSWLEDAAHRCALSGGQWRNVVSHARLLSLQAGRPVCEEHLAAALEREYRKTGASCPLRPMQVRPCPR